MFSEVYCHNIIIFGGFYVIPMPSPGNVLVLHLSHIKRHSAIGTGDFSYMCKVARQESTYFLFIPCMFQRNAT